MGETFDKNGKRQAFAISRRNPRAAIVNTLRERIKNQAKRRGLEFNLSSEEFHSLATGNCFYCKREPHRWCYPTVMLGGRQGKKGYNLERGVKYNGIDRLDSKLGYFTENSVTCCATCNMAKSDMSLEQFKEWIKSVYNWAVGKCL